MCMIYHIKYLFFFNTRSCTKYFIIKYIIYLRYQGHSQPKMFGGVLIINVYFDKKKKKKQKLLNIIITSGGLNPIPPWTRPCAAYSIILFSVTY